MVLNNVRLVAKAREQGNDLFKVAKFSDASMAYGEGLKYDPSNSVLHCNRAACWSKLEKWEKAVDDCNEALRIQPNYTKALLRRAASYAKVSNEHAHVIFFALCNVPLTLYNFIQLERWVDCVRDYEVLRKELPSDKEVAEALFHAQIALKATRGEDVSNMKFGGEVEIVSNVEQLRAAISSPGELFSATSLSAGSQFIMRFTRFLVCQNCLHCLVYIVFYCHIHNMVSV